MFIVCHLTHHVCRQVLTKDEGGRANPFMAEYKPQLFLRTASVTIQLQWPEGTADAEDKMVRTLLLGPTRVLTFVQVMPGDNVEMVMRLVHDVAADVGTR